jgi:NitT/TauT family transport system permease protein
MVLGGKIYPHLAITLWETVLAFAFGSLLGLIVGLWLALSPLAARSPSPTSRRSTRCRA